MVFQIVPDGAEAVVRGSLFGEEVATTFYATHAAGWDDTELAQLADAVDTVWGLGVLPELQANYEYIGTFCRDLRTAVGFQASTNNNAGVGGNSSAGKPNNVTLAIARRSGLSGRAARGRIFLPGINGDMLSAENEVSTTFVTTIEGLLNGMRTAMDAVDWTEVIVSRTGPGTTSTLAVVYTVVEYVVVNRVLDSMRRRLPGRGA